MERIIEQELMTELDQAEGYALANFEESHEKFIDEFQKTFPEIKGEVSVLDVGCGTADISIRFAKKYPLSIINGFDGSDVMLEEGKKKVEESGFSDRIKLFNGLIDNIELERHYDVILCNSVLHHLHEPYKLWKFIKRITKKSRKTYIFIRDLKRPESLEIAREIVRLNTNSNDKEAFKKDFLNSLLAAFNPEEVKKQIKNENLFGIFEVKSYGDLHVLIYGVKK